MPANYYCDKCGKPANGMDYDGDILCVFHRAVKERHELEREYLTLISWLKETHLLHMRDLRRKIKECQVVIDKGNN